MCPLDCQVVAYPSARAGDVDASGLLQGVLGAIVKEHLELESRPPEDSHQHPSLLSQHYRRIYAHGPSHRHQHRRHATGEKNGGDEEQDHRIRWTDADENPAEQRACANRRRQAKRQANGNRLESLPRDEASERGMLSAQGHPYADFASSE